MTQIPFKLALYSFLAPAVFLVPVLSFAHSPHHVISDVASAPIKESNGHTFILITDQIFRSDENGDSWKNLVNGLNNQYSFTAVEVSPEYMIDQTLFVASSGDGIYRSINHGNSWQKLNSGLGKLDILRLSISIAFGSDHRLLAAAESGGVWRSTDGGDSWQMVLTENIVITSFAEIAGKHDRNAVIAGDSVGKIWRSEDNGRLWEIIYELPDAGKITSVSGLRDQIYVGTERKGLYQSQDAGASFVPVLLPQPQSWPVCQEDDSEQAVSDVFITSVAVISEPAGESRVLVTTWHGGLFVSDDNARTWSIWRAGLTCDSQANRISAPHFRDVEIARLGDGNTIYWLAAFDGVFRSVGENSHWQQQETLPLGLIKGLAVTTGKNHPLAVAISTYGGGFYVMHVGESDWTIGNKGLLTTRLTGLDFSPNYSEDNVIYAGAIRELLKSSNRGQSWQRIILDSPSFGRRVLNKLNRWGLPTSWISSSSSKGSSPIYPTHIVALPEDRTGRVLIATRHHGLMAWVESTRSIEPVWSGTDRVINNLAVSPNFESDQTIFLSVRGKGVFRSDNGGMNWSSVNSGLNFVESWAESEGGGDFRRDMYIAISPDFGVDNTLFAGSPASDGLYASHDRGSSWLRLMSDFGMSTAPILAITLSPDFRSDNTLMVSIKGRGLFRSDDKGLHFEAVGEQLINENASIELLEYSPDFANDQSIVAASDEKLFISIDRGNTWAEVKRPVRYEDMREVIKFDGDWKQNNGEHYSAMTETTASKKGSGAHMRFVGGGIRWLGSQGPGYGSAQVYIDGELVETVSCRSDKYQYMLEIFSVQGLEFGPHNIEIRVNSEVTGLRSGTVAIDAFDVLP